MSLRNKIGARASHLYAVLSEWFATIATPMHRSLNFLLNFMQCMSVLATLFVSIAIAISPWLSTAANIIPFAQVGLLFAIGVSLIYAYWTDKKEAKLTDAISKVTELDDQKLPKIEDKLTTLEAALAALQNSHKQASELEALGNKEIVSTVIQRDVGVQVERLDKETQVDEESFCQPSYVM